MQPESGSVQSNADERIQQLMNLMINKEVFQYHHNYLAPKSSLQFRILEPSALQIRHQNSPPQRDTQPR